MAYRNGKKIVETTKTRREALERAPVWIHISKLPNGKKGDGETFKYDKGELIVRGKKL